MKKVLHHTADDIRQEKVADKIKHDLYIWPESLQKYWAVNLI